MKTIETITTGMAPTPVTAAPKKHPASKKTAKPAGKNTSKSSTKKPTSKPASKQAARPVQKTPRADTKKTLVLELLRRKQGATTAEIAKVTDWQKHSIRGFISGHVTKKMGLKVESVKSESGDRTYQIAK